MPLPSISTTYASLSSRPSTSASSACSSRPPRSSPSTLRSASAAAASSQNQPPEPGNAPVTDTAATAPSLRSSQLKSYLANKNNAKPMNPSTSKPLGGKPASTPLPRMSAPSSAASASSSSKKPGNKAVALDEKLKHLQALSAPIKRPRAALDSSTASSSRAAATASSAASSGHARPPNKSRKLNPPTTHQQNASVKSGGARRPPSSSNRIGPLPAAARRGHHAGSASASAPPRLAPPPPPKLADTTTATHSANPSPMPPPPAPSMTTYASTAPTQPIVPDPELEQELASLRTQLDSERALRAATARDLVLLQAGVELMHAESASKLTSLSTQLAHAHDTIAALEAQHRDTHAALTQCNKQWQAILFDELDKLEGQARAGVKVAVGRAAAAKREAGVWKRRAEAAEGMVRWYEKVVGGVDGGNKGVDKEDEVSERRRKRRETWAPTASGWRESESKEEAVVFEEDKENASLAQVEQAAVSKDERAEVDKKKTSRRTVA